MARVLFISLFLLFLPFVAYGGWQKFMRGKDENSTIWQDAPVVWIMLSGVILAVAGLIGMMFSTGMAG